MTQTVTLNGKQLHGIAHASHTATVTITALALRERLRHFSDINRTKTQLIRQGEKIVDSDYSQMWKDLQAAGVGSIIYGRRGKPDRFEWHYSLKKVAKAALEGTNEEVQKLANAPTKSKSKLVKSKSRPKLYAVEKADRAKQADSVNVGRGLKMVCIALRKDFNVEFTLPANITKDEASFISSYISRLSA